MQNPVRLLRFCLCFKNRDNGLDEITENGVPGGPITDSGPGNDYFGPWEEHAEPGSPDSVEGPGLPNDHVIDPYEMGEERDAPDSVIVSEGGRPKIAEWYRTIPENGNF